MSKERTACENCGGKLELSAKTGRLECENCGYSLSIKIERASEQDYLTYKASTSVSQNNDWKTGTYVIKCKSCGATEIMNSGNLADVCPFCGSANIEDSAEDAGMMPNGIVPFKITKEEAFNSINERVKKSAWAPKDFKANFRIDGIKGVYTPVYSFDAEANGYYNGRFGKDYTTTHTDSSGRSYTTTHTKWFDRQGTAFFRVDDLLIEAGSKITGSILRELEPYATNSAVKYDKKFLMGYAASTSSKSLEDSYERCEHILYNRTRDLIIKQNNADHVQTLNLNLKYQNVKFKYLLLPVYTSSFTYKNQTHNIFVNGATGKVSGKLPVSGSKVFWTIAIPLLIILGILAAIFLPQLF